MADLWSNNMYRPVMRRRSSLSSNISRLVIDFERFLTGPKEPMHKHGMGAFYTRTSTGERLRFISADRRKVLQTVYRQYHEALSDLVADTIRSHGRALILDLHTFPSEPRSYELDRRKPRPDVCIGTDFVHTEPELSRSVAAEFKRRGYSVKLNSPYSGCIVPAAFQKDPRIQSIMIEINRRLYVDELAGKRHPLFKNVQSDIGQSLNHAIDVYEKNI